MERKGVISVWINGRNFGYIMSDGDKIFLHRSRIKSGRPVVGAKVEFGIHPVIEGSCPTAINVVIEAFVTEGGAR